MVKRANNLSAFVPPFQGLNIHGGVCSQGVALGYPVARFQRGTAGWTRLAHQWLPVGTTINSVSTGRARSSDGACGFDFVAPKALNKTAQGNALGGGPNLSNKP
jgi:hypothetical protein